MSKPTKAKAGKVKSVVHKDLLGDAKLDFVDHRVKRFEEIFARQEGERKSLGDIEVTLPDGKVIKGEAGVTSPLDIAKGISAGLARSIIVAKLDGEQLWDADRPLEKSCSLELLKFDNDEARHVFWHSSSHVLGQTLERLFAGKLTIGPAIEGGFYYDVDLDGGHISNADYDSIEKMVQRIQKEKQPFQRVVLTKEEALDMFQENKFKQIIISEKVPDGETCTVYRCGPLIDLCRGPHIPNTSLIKALRVLKNSAAYWKADANNEQLQRVYGVSFPDKKAMKEHMELLKQAEERNHRRLGLEQDLFFFHPLSPGSAFWQPHGSRIYNTLLSFMRGEYRKRGYEEVITPNMYNMDLWKTSGHAQNYEENMFGFEVEGHKFALKPMNCPGHCLMFKHRLRSYREMPVRFADFGVLHRNELSGALHGLTRVRRFQQDDAHIFCTVEQIEAEIFSCLEFIRSVYGVFGFTFTLELSTRPEKYLGEVEVWDQAENALSNCLNKFDQEWKLNPGDGAFYGPKIDITLFDALKRAHQCATIQLDFQLPIRFDLQYNTGKKEDPMARPVIVHRAIFGSLERFIAILTEHTGGKWPFWVSPRQAIVVPINLEKHLDYANKVHQQLHDAGYFVDVDSSHFQLNKKIRNAQLAQYNFILVVGFDEENDNTVNIRTRDNKRHGTKPMAELLEWFGELASSRSVDH